MWSERVAGASGTLERGGKEAGAGREQSCTDRPQLLWLVRTQDAGERLTYSWSTSGTLTLYSQKGAGAVERDAVWYAGRGWEFSHKY